MNKNNYILYITNDYIIIEWLNDGKFPTLYKFIHTKICNVRLSNDSLNIQKLKGGEYTFHDGSEEYNAKNYNLIKDWLIKERDENE